MPDIKSWPARQLEKEVKMEITNLNQSYEDAYLADFEKGFAIGFTKSSLVLFATLAAYSISGGKKKIPNEDLANCPWPEKDLLDLVTGAVKVGLAEGKLYAVASLRRKGYPNIQLDDGTKITDEEIIKLNSNLPF
jgi:hypothetical protein